MVFKFFRSETEGIFGIHFPAFLPNLFIFKEKNKKDFPSSQG